MVRYITAEHKAELEKELVNLKTELTEVIASRLADNTSKNQAEDSEYAQAIQERDMVQERIEELEKILEASTVIKMTGGNPDYVTLGSWVTIQINGTKKELRIVGASEANPSNGSISYESPLGEALIGAKKGETVFVMGPTGNEQEVEVLSVRVASS